MLNKFSSEHWHDEDEVRFIVEGRGLFHIHPQDGAVFAIEVEAGDLIRVPRGTHHWFDLCADRRIRAIRLFQDASGWTPHYTQSGVDRNFQPVCFGPSYFPRIPPVTRPGDPRDRGSRLRHPRRPAGYRRHHDADLVCPRDAVHVCARTLDDYLAHHWRDSTCRRSSGNSRANTPPNRSRDRLEDRD
jgi:hypothetical protein